MPDLSVVIPTRDRPDLLRDCLTTLGRQSLAKSLEVLVIDDGSPVPLADRLQTIDTGGATLRIERQRAAGLNTARNRGLEVATADLVAFLDDDTLIVPEWAEAVLQAFSQPGCDAVGGRVELCLEGPRPPWLDPGLRSYLSEFDEGGQSRWLDKGPVPVGANCAVRRAAGEAVGAFRVGLDRTGTSLISNGDTEFFRRLRARGYRIRYEPRAKVIHRVPTERLTLAFFRRRAYAQGISDQLLVRLDTDVSPTRQGIRELVRLGRTVPIFLRAIVEGRGPTAALLWSDYCRGRLASVRKDIARVGSQSGVARRA